MYVKRMMMMVIKIKIALVEGETEHRDAPASSQELERQSVRKPRPYRLPATAWANQLIQPARNPLAPPKPSLTHRYPPPASGKAEPNSA